MKRHSTRNLQNPANRESNQFTRDHCFIFSKLYQTCLLRSHQHSCNAVGPPSNSLELCLSEILTFLTNFGLLTILFIVFACIPFTQRHSMSRSPGTELRVPRGGEVNTRTQFKHRFTVQLTVSCWQGRRMPHTAFDRSVPLASTSHMHLGFSKDCTELSNRRTLLIYIC